jgi:type II secretory ATPase GspE/PulE/Tfp pilus assembly ATPase PilB-like protein
MGTVASAPAARVNGKSGGDRPAINASASHLIQAEQAIRLRAVPFAVVGGRLRVAMLSADDFAAADEVSVVSGMPVTPVIVHEDVLKEMLREAYGITAAEMAARLAGRTAAEEAAGDGIANLEAVEADELHRMAEQPTLINLVNLLILEAIRSRTSDIHIEPFEKLLNVKYRIDGVLITQPSPPKHLQPAITSRVKIMAGMNIAERYVPQDGHITLRYEGRKVDIRVSTVPTLYGESVVMRILDKESVSLDLASLGMREPDRREVDRLIALPHGMVLVTGPTGSGKTTSLYAALSKLYDPTKKIITIEDPVEYELAGVNQIPVNPKRGLSFATGLRSILRQDPDIIMVGEIRDRETAEIAVRSALTGHLLFSTLHTNDAASAVGRLLDMGVEPFLLASVLEGVIAQRLGRRICRMCGRPDPLSDAVLHRLAPAELALFPGQLATRGAGCEACDKSGYRGRIGYYELLRVNAEMRAGIGRRLNAAELLAALGPSHVTMRRDGLLKAAEGKTTVEEVLRATQDVGEG